MAAYDILVKNLSNAGAKIEKRERDGAQVTVGSVVDSDSLIGKIKKILPGYSVLGDGYIIVVTPRPKTKAPAPNSRW